MRIVLIAFIVLNGKLANGQNISEGTKPPVRTVLELTLLPEQYPYLLKRGKMVRGLGADSFVVYVKPVLHGMDLGNNQSMYKFPIINDQVRIFFLQNEPVLITCEGLSGLRIEPGDSLQISFGKPLPGVKDSMDWDQLSKIVTGNAVDRVKLQVEYRNLVSNINKAHPHMGWTAVKSFDDFQDLLSAHNEILIKSDSLIKSYRGKVKAEFLDYFKFVPISAANTNKIYAFLVLAKAEKNIQELRSYYKTVDTLLNMKWLDNQPFVGLVNPNLYWIAAGVEWANKMNFDLSAFDYSVKRDIAFYNIIKENYKGEVRERALQHFIVTKIIENEKHYGLKHPWTEAVLADYYRQPGFPQYKTWMTNYVRDIPERFKIGDDLPPFEDLLAIYQLDESVKFSEKRITVFDFSKLPCKTCPGSNIAFQDVKARFSKDPSISFITLEPKNQRWQEVVGWLLKKDITFPLLVDSKGQIVNYPTGDLHQSIAKLKNELKDGPYVFYTDKLSGVSVHRISYEKGHSTTTSDAKPRDFYVSTDIAGKTFTVKLKNGLTAEPSEFIKPPKQLVMSDIEGNFDAFRKLLQKNGVIDANFNWIYGKGHVVLIGDMLDRGNQVTECLWLIYSLEDKAKSAGGYVHYILGNHEILNTSGDTRYVQAKYTDNAKLMKLDYKELYGENSEIGRWLRTKNIVEKIGDVIYTHGGFDKKFNAINIPLTEINSTIRPHLANRDDFKQNANEPVLMILFNSTISPFWYRGYYSKKESYRPASVSQIDSTLQKFNVNHIVTGHTIVADTVSMHYSGKIFNTDVHHAEGKSEALLIEGNKYYRVNDKGKRWLLFDDTKQKNARVGVRNKPTKPKQ